MKHVTTKSPMGVRQHRLNIASHTVRIEAVTRGYDLDGWRLSHLMRDAKTHQQIDFAERGYGMWLQTARAMMASG
jgi:hypothetical protein